MSCIKPYQLGQTEASGLTFINPPHTHTPLLSEERQDLTVRRTCRPVPLETVNKFTQASFIAREP